MIPTVLRLLYDFLFLKNDVNVPLKRRVGTVTSKKNFKRHGSEKHFYQQRLGVKSFFRPIFNSKNFNNDNKIALKVIIKTLNNT